MNHESWDYMQKYKLKQAYWIPIKKTIVNAMKTFQTIDLHIIHLLPNCFGIYIVAANLQVVPCFDMSSDFSTKTQKYWYIYKNEIFLEWQKDKIFS